MAPDPPRRENLSASLTDPDIAEGFGAGQWRFTEAVADQFDDHVRASVPHYDAMQDMIAEAADWLLPPGSLLADLGCSTGTTALRILNRHPGRGLRVVLYDEQTSMLAKARPAVEALAPGRVESHVQQLQAGLHHAGAAMTVCAFALQFLPPADRLVLLKRALRGAVDGGALIVAEKTRPTDPRWAEIANEVSHDVKAGNGISDAAIRAKARALRGILVPYPLEATRDMIAGAGWSTPEVLFAWHSWVLLGAFKPLSGHGRQDRARTAGHAGPVIHVSRNR